jgi:amino acid adenylation domain-containing protein
MSVPQCFHDLFEMQADATPGAMALVCDDVQWTYGELEERANQVARLLRSRGIGPGKFVGLYLKRSEMSVVAILATLKCGGAYVPLDPGFPPMRIQHIVEEAQIGLVITDAKFAAQAREQFTLPLVVCEADNPDIAAQAGDRLSRDETGVSPSDLCYVLYTSGTTGRPKGVMTEHHNVVFFAESFKEETQLRASDRVYHGFALGFDGSVEELCMAWTNGACLVVGVGEVAQMGNDATRLFVERGVTVFSTVPTCLRMLQDDVPSLRLVIVSGEPCPPELVGRWTRPGRRMLNVYGPTETTVNTTCKELVPDAPVTIGRPLRGYQTLILSPEMQPVPPGHSGELFIGGRGLARGYLSQPELTAKQFVPNPLYTNGSGPVRSNGNGHANGVDRAYPEGRHESNGNGNGNGHGYESSGDAGNGRTRLNGHGVNGANGAVPNGKPPANGYGLSARLYRTGDLVQLNDDGELLFLGRIDQQVKIRGYRIELSEIEEVLREHPSIEQAVVKVHEKDGRKELAAYVVTSGAAALDRDAIVQWLRDRTPIYMVPAYLDEIAELPTLASGKVDRSRLPEPQMPLVPTSREIVDPETPDEANIAAVWKTLLKIDQASVEDDFFMDLGGYSLLAAELVTKLRQDHGYDLSIRDVYSHPTIRKMAAHVAAAKSGVGDAAEKAIRISSREAFHSVGRLTRWTVYCLQAVSTVLLYGIRTLPILVSVVLTMMMLQGRVELGTYVWTLSGLVLVAPPAGIVLSIALKWAVIGRYKPGDYPVWSFYYFRWWLVSRAQYLAWTDL